MAETKTKQGSTFSAEEKAAMKERARELKAERSGKGDGESDVLAKIAEMQKSDRVLAEKFHKLVRTTAPELVPRTWYGFPAYTKDGKVLCHFQPAQKFKTRYATFAFSDVSSLDDGALWPVGFAVTEWNADVESRITELVKRAVG